MKYDNPRGKPHQHLIPWDAHMVKSQNTIIHTVICTTTKFSTNITKGNTRKRGVILQASQLHDETWNQDMHKSQRKRAEHLKVIKKQTLYHVCRSPFLQLSIERTRLHEWKLSPSHQATTANMKETCNELSQKIFKNI